MKPRAHKPVPDVTRPQRVLACRRHLFRHDARPSPCEPTPFAPQMCGLSGSCSRILCKLGAVSCEKTVCHVSDTVPFRAMFGVRGNAACDGQIGVA